MQDHDVAISAVGPFFKFETKLARAAIEAGVDYASVCDEWDATEEVFEQLSQPARDSGRIILTGLGASPGMTNVGIRYLAQDLDALRRVDIYVYVPLSTGGGEAVIRHMLHVMTGEIVSWRDGRRTVLRACSEARTVEFPEFGPVRLWNMGHAEPVTVPRYFDDVQEVNFYMGFGRGSQLFVRPAQLGAFHSDRIVDGISSGLVFAEKLLPLKPTAGAVRVDVSGPVDGRERHRTLCGVGQMREVTGISLAVGALMLGRRQLLTETGGVFAPEGCLLPQPFIAAMKDKGVCAYSDLEMNDPIG